MPRTLFNLQRSSDCCKNMKETVYSQYIWLPQVRVLPIGDNFVFVNPDNGGWVAFSKEEYEFVKNLNEQPQGQLGEFLYQFGLCSRDKEIKQFITTDKYSKELYFFEFCVTTRCNLHCSYCFADASPSFSSGDATPEIAEEFIDRVAEHRVNNQTCTPYIIEFTGGEPLLNFKVIKHTVDYAKKAYGNLLNATFCIQSNVTLLTENILDFLKREEISIGVSCDGFKTAHDNQRPFESGCGSHKVVEKNMKSIKNHYSENTGGVISVITKKNIDFMPEIALYFYLLGYPNIVMRCVQKIGRANNDDSLSFLEERYVTGLFKTLTSIIEPIYRQTGQLIEERYLALTFQYLLSPARNFMCERSPCGGAKNICAVQPNGDVYPCNQSVDKRFYLGNIKEKSFKDILKSDVARIFSKRVVENIEECKLCVFRSWCGSSCTLGSHSNSESFLAKSAECELNKLRYTYALLGLLGNKFDLEVIGKFMGVNNLSKWFEFKFN